MNITFKDLQKTHINAYKDDLYYAQELFEETNDLKEMLELWETKPMTAWFIDIGNRRIMWPHIYIKSYNKALQFHKEIFNNMDLAEWFYTEKRLGTFKPKL